MSLFAPTQRRNARLLAVGLAAAIAFLAVAFLAARSAGGAEPPAEAAPSAEAEAAFEREVRPILVAACGECHGAKKQESGLRLDSRAGMLRGGDSGPAVNLASLEKSLLLDAIGYEGDIQMPPRGKLPAGQIEVLKRWIASGAPWPEAVGGDVVRSGEITEADRRHWAFQPVAAPSLPVVKDAAWPSGPIDRFVLARLEAAGAKPVADADRRTLIRRATFDLIGLPPTPEEVADFLADESPEAFARVVDRLLASPHYGERWGRHWLDVARYADTAGDGADYPIREAYKYRNYVINALNADLPYDQFLREQIAGDILAAEAPDNPRFAEQVTATGYIAVTKRFGYNINTEFQHLDISDTLESVGRSLLGLSLGCARCHDHKYEPITARDYYALYGIFASSNYSFPGGEEYQKPHNLVPLVTPAVVAEREGARKARIAEFDAQLGPLTETRNKQAEAVKQANEAAAKTTTPDAEAIKKLQGELAASDAQLKNLQQQKAEAAVASLYEVAYGVSEGQPQNAKIQKRGEPLRLGDEVPRRFIEILGGDSLPTGVTGSGRKQLAEWIVRPANPLTARVMVNRLWQHHFGRGIVGTPSDFGLRGDRPTHPELLDYLAAKFMADGWSLKRMHRELMLSHTYQLSSADNPEYAAVDPMGTLFGRFVRRALDAEGIRDALLAVSGRLDRSQPAGHPFPPVSEWRFSIHYPFHAVYDSPHRSVYMMIQRSRRNPYLALFDAADPNISTAVRELTITPTQALFLMNSPFLHEQTQLLADRVLAENAGETDRVARAYLVTTQRAPTAEEAADAAAFLSAYRQQLGGDAIAAERGAWAALARVLVTSNEFLYVD